jgi:hypothetical protein
MPTRTSIYLEPADLERLARIKEQYGLKTSAAVRLALAQLERTLSREVPPPRPPVLTGVGTRI